jgi:hypothetical protein
MIPSLIIMALFIGAGIYFFFTDVTMDERPYKQYHFQNAQFSVQEYYALMEKDVYEQKIKGLKVTRYSYREGGIFSFKREYLTITFNALYIEVCAFHFGSGLSVTCRHGMKTYVRNILESKSFFNRVIKAIFFPQTAYRLDTEQAYKNNVDACVTAAINSLTSSQGIRQ